MRGKPAIRIAPRPSRCSQMLSTPIQFAHEAQSAWHQCVYLFVFIKNYENNLSNFLGVRDTQSAVRNECVRLAPTEAPTTTLKYWSS